MDPLVTCICVTDRRVSFLKTAIKCYQHQTYSNKELLIVYRIEDNETRNYIHQLNDPSIRSLSIASENHLTLGEIRNMSISASNGEYFCQWDDDDWYHSYRLEHQLNSVLKSGKECSVLMRLLFYDAINSKAYFSYARPWENSILCKRSILDDGFFYPKLNQKEDTIFVKELLSKNMVSLVDYNPVYIYVYHGNNTWNKDHFEYMFSHSQLLSTYISSLIKDVLAGTYNNNEASEKLMETKVIEEFIYVSANT